MYAKKIELQALFREPDLDQAKFASKPREIVALQLPFLPRTNTGRGIRQTPTSISNVNRYRRLAGRTTVL